MFLGLFFCNIGFAYEYKNIVKNLKCYSQGIILRNLDIKNDKNYRSYISDDEVEFSLIIDAKEVGIGVWDASLLEINFAGKYEYDITEIKADIGNELKYINASGNWHGDTYIFRIVGKETSDNDEKYYTAQRVSLKNIKLIPKKKELVNMNKERFNFWVNTYACLE